MQGWIKLHRKIQGSQMFKSLNSKQRDVMINCLLMANHEDNEWEWNNEIYECKPGQFLTSLENIKNKCANDVKVQSVRTALLKLEKWGFLTNKSTKTGRLITICKWDSYQIIESNSNNQLNKELTKSQQSSNKELTTNKNEKNEKNNKYTYNEFYDEQIKISGDNKIYIQFVIWLFKNNPTEKPLSKVLKMSDQIKADRLSVLLASYKGDEIKDVILSLENTTKKYNSFNLTISNWLKR